MRAVFGVVHWLILLLVVLNACTTTPIKEFGPGKEAAYQARAETLESIQKWSFVGKLSLDDGEQGGSGRLQWDVRSGTSDLDFHGAMGRGAWRLQIGPDSAILTEADGSERRAAGVNALIQDRMGWPIPVDALQWWVRGLAAPGTIEDEVLSPDGRLLKLVQFGWSVDFKRYDSATGLNMPVRLEAAQGSYRVKLAIGRWQMDTGAGE